MLPTSVWTEEPTRAVISLLLNPSTPVALLDLALGACRHGPTPLDIPAPLSASRIDSFQLSMPERGDRDRTSRGPGGGRGARRRHSAANTRLVIGRRGAQRNGVGEPAPGAPQWLYQ